ncbi:MAG: nitroreductase family protein [Clostridium perfringens]|nr:nitroreductase family protein [Clostridium perfringens]
MNEVIKTILERRSIRKFKDEQISENELKQILDAGLHAPTAGGLQSSVFLVCQDKEVNDRLGRINRSIFGFKKVEGLIPSKTQVSIAEDVTIKSAFYGAPTVITLFAPEKWIYGADDCLIAAENICIAAQSLGIGSCIIARSKETFETEEGKELMKKMNIDSDYVARIHVILGYPQGEIGHGKPLKENRVRRI